MEKVLTSAETLVGLFAIGVIFFLYNISRSLERLVKNTQSTNTESIATSLQSIHRQTGNVDSATHMLEHVVKEIGITVAVMGDRVSDIDDTLHSIQHTETQAVDALEKIQRTLDEIKHRLEQFPS